MEAGGMTDDLRYKISDELLHAICSLQDAFAYVQYAEQLALGRCNGGYGGDLRFRISALRRQINNAVTHAAIIRDISKGEINAD
jgi:hypothetical protein